MNKESEQIIRVLSNLPEGYDFIFKEILEAEKEVLHRKNLQGTTIINSIMDIVKERVK